MMFRYDIQCDNTYSDHTRYVCSLAPEEAGDDQLSHNLICLSLLGLGDIVIPGIFVALCLRYDIIKTLNAGTVNKLMEKSLKIKTPMSRYSDMDNNKEAEQAKVNFE